MLPYWKHLWWLYACCGSTFQQFLINLSVFREFIRGFFFPFYISIQTPTSGTVWLVLNSHMMTVVLAYRKLPPPLLWFTTFVDIFSVLGAGEKKQLWTIPFPFIVHRHYCYSPGSGLHYLQFLLVSTDSSCIPTTATDTEYMHQ